MKVPVNRLRPADPDDRQRGTNPIRIAGTFLSVGYLAITLALELGHVFTVSLWPGVLAGAVSLTWILFIATISRRIKSNPLLAYSAFFIQALLITTIVYFIGGLQGPLPVFHTANAAAATFILGPIGGVFIAVISLLSLAALWIMENLGWIPVYAVWDVSSNWLAIVYFCYYAVPVLGAVVTVSSILTELMKWKQAIKDHQENATSQLKALEDARTHAKLESSRLEAILWSTHEGMLLYDNEGKLIYSNPVVDQLIASTTKRENRITLGSTWSGSLSKSLGQELESARQNPHIVTHRVLTLNGRPIRHIEVDGCPVSNKDKTIIGRLLILRDITDQKRLEAVRDEWTHLLVHDLRSPLVSVIGNLELVDEMIETDDQQYDIHEGVKVACRSARSLLNMVNSLLDISKLEAGKETLELLPVSLPHLAESVQIEFSPITLQAGLNLDVIAPPDLPQVLGDRAKLQRVFVNLVDNAIKFTPDGGSITIQMAETSGKVRVSITDTGPGIPEEQHHAIFDRFAQLPGSRTRRSGTGLGLTLCKLVVEAHGGRIWVETPPDGGSRFVLTLPSIVGTELDNLEVID